MSESTVTFIETLVIIAIIIAYLWSGFYLTKKRFNSEKFIACRKVTPLPAVYNYWLLKIILFGGAILLLWTLPIVISRGW